MWDTYGPTLAQLRLASRGAVLRSFGADSFRFVIDWGRVLAGIPAGMSQPTGGQVWLGDVEVTKHLKKIFESGELDEKSVCAFFAQTADDGKTYRYKFYALPAIIAVGYRVNSQRAAQFRQWATKVLDTFTKQGYVLDKDRLINGRIFSARIPQERDA